MSKAALGCSLTSAALEVSLVKVALEQLRQCSHPSKRQKTTKMLGFLKWSYDNLTFVLEA